MSLCPFNFIPSPVHDKVSLCPGLTGPSISGSRSIFKSSTVVFCRREHVASRESRQLVLFYPLRSFCNLQLHLRKLEYGEKVFIVTYFKKLNIYILDSLHVKYNISKVFFGFTLMIRIYSSWTSIISISKYYNIS